MGEHHWSPYYRIDYDYANANITVNLIGHQEMKSCGEKFPAYAIPYLLQRDAQLGTGKPSTESGSLDTSAKTTDNVGNVGSTAPSATSYDEVLIIGAGSGNDVSRALQWGAHHVDAVEIDPAIQRLGKRDHPDRPYDDEKRVSVHIADGRNFLRSAPAQKYDLIVYALVDSLVLHSSYSNIRLESYLFTDQAFADVRRCLKPGGLFVMYNYFRQGFILHRLHKELEQAFQAEPLVIPLPYRDPIIHPEERSDGFTIFLAGEAAATEPVRQAFQKHTYYWLCSNQVPTPVSANGFENGPEDPQGWEQLSEHEQAESDWLRLGLVEIAEPAEAVQTASDDWPFLYLRSPMIPNLSLRGMALMGGIALIFLFLFMPRREEPALERATQTGAAHYALRFWRSALHAVSLDGRMLFLGTGFMLIETKAVVHMALLFGSTWMVNSVVFFAVLVMILASNLFVLIFKPERLWPYYAGLAATLTLNCMVSLEFFLGMTRNLQVAGACLLVFTPMLFAGVIFAVSFRRSAEPNRAFGANIAGAMLGGLAEYSSMLLGFQYLVLVAMGFYAFSAFLGSTRQGAQPAQRDVGEKHDERNEVSLTSGLSYRVGRAGHQNRCRHDGITES